MDSDFINDDGTPMNGKQRREAKQRTKRAQEEAATAALMQEARDDEDEAIEDLDAAANKRLSNVAHKLRQEVKAKAAGPVLPGLPRLPKAPRKSKPPRSCECGCGGMTKGGRFIPGHDARLAAWALRVERKLITMKEVPDMHKKAVANLLKLKAVAPIKL